MTIEVVAFIIGGILIGTAVVGGGFEIREIKMPHVGAGVRIVSLLVGSCFLLLALSMWGLNNSHLLAEPSAAAALAPGAQAPSAVSGARSATSGGSSGQAESRVQEPVAPRQVQAPAVEPFTGFSGDTYLSWEIEGTRLSAAARFSGMNGMVRIAWPDPATGLQMEVLQDLVLQQDQDGVIFYQGVNPRHAATQQFWAEYNPDRFRVVQANGGWTIDYICDVQGCWPVTVQ